LWGWLAGGVKVGLVLERERRTLGKDGPTEEVCLKRVSWAPLDWIIEIGGA
jgi:hypothetical protein